MDKETYEKRFKGFFIHDCAIRGKSFLYFTLIESYTNEGDGAPTEHMLRKRVLAHYPYDPEGDQWGHGGVSGFGLCRLGAVPEPKGYALLVDGSGQVFAYGSGRNEIEKNIPDGPDGPIRPSVRSFNLIDGVLYGVGGWRGVFFRDPTNDAWVSLCKASLLPEPSKALSSSFNAIAGFNRNDIYCAGSYGDVWRYDGKKWFQCHFPTNMLLENVCCAGDGFVYIGGQNGSVIKGREDKWQILHKGDLSLPFQDMVWYQDRVWCTSDYGVWQIVGDKLIEANLPPEIKSCAGNLSTADGVLLLAGMYGAALHDGKEWKVVINPFQLAKDYGP